MKIDTNTRFPYPVLSSDTSDFSKGILEVDFGVKEDEVANTLSLFPNVRLSHPLFERFRDEDRVRIVVDIHCSDTYYNEIKDIDEECHLHFCEGVLSGRVILRPLILASENIEFDAPEDLNSEFNAEKISYKKNSIVGWSEQTVIQVGRRKLAPIDSIFSLARNDDLAEGVISVDPDAEKIFISAAGRTFEHIDSMRRQFKEQAVILNSVYLPAIMQLLDSLRSGSDYSDYEWYKTFMAKCDFYGIAPISTDLLGDAQKLLRSPYTRLEKAFNESE